MLYCSNPTCSNPFNPDRNKFCTSCGSQTLSPLFRNRYRVIQLLGEGGFGRTYEAIDTDRMDDPCVIKQFVPQVQGTAALEKATELFKQEAKRLYELGEHPQIPRLIAYFEQDKRLYLVQELIEGQTLLAELQQQGAFSEEKIRQFLGDLLPVLKIVHERGVIHRDIKPENIMRRRQDGKLMLIDFGVSKQVTATILGQAGTKVGTHGYAPIEQMRGQVYPASDLYSLGVTCIRLLTYCLPKEDGFDDLYDALNGGWVWQERLPGSTAISSQLGQVLDKLLQDYVKERYQSADEVLQILNSATSKSSHLSPKNLLSVIPIPVSCPNCYHNFKVAQAGGVDCPRCNWKFEVDLDGSILAGEPIAVACPSCYHNFQVAQAGILDCSKCNWKFEVDVDGSILAGEPIAVACPSCYHNFQVAQAGILDCPKCNWKFEVDVDGNLLD
jgi:serine/threonine protein kinase/ribosomal protein L37AE/L43A